MNNVMRHEYRVLSEDEKAHMQTIKDQGLKKEKRAAILTVFDAPVMTKRGRKRIAAWLRKQAEFLEHEGHVYAKRFTARYLYK